MPRSAASTRNLQKLLAGSVQRVRGDESFVMPEELFQRFEVGGLDVSGATSSGYSENGKNLTAGLTVNVAALAGFPALVKLEVAGKVEGGRGRRTMLVLRRMPGTIGTVHRSHQTLGFLAFDGVHWTIKLGLEVAAGVGPPDDFEGLTLDSATGVEELSLDLKVGAAVGASGAAGFYEARAEWPEFYAHSSDQALRARFRDLMSNWKKDEIKDYAAELLNRISDETAIGNNIAGGLRPPKHATALGLASPYHTGEIVPLLKHVVDLCTGPSMKTYHAKAVVLLEQLKAVKDTVKGDALDWLAAHPAPAPPKRSRGAVGRYPSAELLAAIQSVLDAGKDARGAALDRRARAEGEALVPRLRKFTDEAADLPAADDFRAPWRSLGQFKLMTFGGGLEASAGAKAGAVVASTDPNAELAIKGVQVSSKAGISGQAVRSRFRFQCWLKNDHAAAQPLVETQDTTIDYRQVDFEASGTLKGMKKSLVKRETSKRLYNSLHWSAAIARWLYPAATATGADLLTGSGYCLGISVQYSRFFADCNDPAKRDAYFRFLAKALGITPAAQAPGTTRTSKAPEPPSEGLARFARETWLLQPGEKIELPNDVLLLEAAHVPARPQTAALKKPGKPNYSEPGEDAAPGTFQLGEGLLQQFQTLHKGGGMALQAIRLGYRMAEYEDNGKTKLNFKLGLREGVELGIHLRSIAEAGFDSVIEIATWWADPALAREPDQARAWERAVPRVALFHQ